MAYLKPAEREDQIVAAAIGVLSEVGVPATTLRAVAAAADVPLGTLHYVFPSKDQLLRSVIATVVDQTAELIRAGLEVDRGVEKVVRQGLTSFWDSLVDGGVGLQLMQYELLSYSLRTEGSGGLARLQFERYSALVTEFCEEAAAQAGERCAVGYDALGRLALAAIDGLVLQYAAVPDPERSRRDLGHAIEMLLLYADPQPVARKRRR